MADCANSEGSYQCTCSARAEMVIAETENHAATLTNEPRMTESGRL